MDMTSLHEGNIYIKSRASAQSVASIHGELIELLDQFYYSVVRVDLQDGTGCILQSAGHPTAIAQLVNWNQYLDLASSVILEERRSDLQLNLSWERLLERYRSGETTFSLDAPYLLGENLSTLSCFVLLKARNGVPTAYVMTRDSHEDCLRKQLVEQYVHRSFDFLCYLDARHNSCTMFGSAEDGSPLPPSPCSNFEEKHRAFVEKAVDPKDRKRVLLEMSLPRVLKQLEKHEVHTFYCGVMDPKRGYTRKRFDFRYYERSTQMILVSCADITDMYLTERRRNRALLEALRRAQTDALTGLLNYQGTVQNITDALQLRPERAALLFIDLDYFKTVNDNCGHMVGDRVLKDVADVLRREASGGPIIGRFGGDEFIVFFPEIDAPDTAREYADRVCRAVLAIDYPKPEGVPHISCSIGIVAVPENGAEYTALVKLADDTAYQAKAAGKNRVAVYGEDPE